MTVEPRNLRLTLRESVPTDELGGDGIRSIRFHIGHRPACGHRLAIKGKRAEREREHCEQEEQSKILRPPNDEKNSWLSVAAKGMIR